jgi:hypothetical protein
LQEKQLAYALGYPMDWRVERTVTYSTGEHNYHKKGVPVIRDRIHAVGGKKNKTKFMWLNHEAAQKAALLYQQEGTLTPAAVTDDNNNKNTTSTSTTGSHLLPPTPLYKKGDVVQVLYENKWFEATVTKRKKKDDEFYYGVYYGLDGTQQDDIPEDEVRPGEDPSELAVSLGFPSDWMASRKGSRYVITSPDGQIFSSKKAAMDKLHQLRGVTKKKENKTSTTKDVNPEDDPPWRETGHELIGRQIMYTTMYKASATRCINIEQVGTIAGYIHANDKDKVRLQSSPLWFG